MYQSRVAIGALIVFICAGCRETPTFVTKYGSEVFDPTGWIPTEDLDAVEDYAREVFIARGISPRAIDKCFAETEIDVLEKLDCPSAGPCYGVQRGETLEVLIDGKRELSTCTVLHELAHRLFDFSTGDGDSDHSDPIWTGHDADKALVTWEIYLCHKYDLE